MSLNYNSYCMRFSNYELKEHLIEKIREKAKGKVDIRILSENAEELDDDSDANIETVVFDGKQENLFINFFGIHTSIVVFDKEIMFIDENSKDTYTSSDVFNNVVYEGEMRKMSHEEMLRMFTEIILCFLDATDINVLKSAIPEEKEYRKYNYNNTYMFVINVQNDSFCKCSKTFENITINY